MKRQREEEDKSILLSSLPIEILQNVIHQVALNLLACIESVRTEEPLTKEVENWCTREFITHFKPLSLSLVNASFWKRLWLETQAALLFLIPFPSYHEYLVRPNYYKMHCLAKNHFFDHEQRRLIMSRDFTQNILLASPLALRSIYREWRIHLSHWEAYKKHKPESYVAWWCGQECPCSQCKNRRDQEVWCCWCSYRGKVELFHDWREKEYEKRGVWLFNLFYCERIVELLDDMIDNDIG